MNAHWFLILSVFLMALLYSSVGHGGASGYLAILSIASMPVQQMAASALLLNLLVATIALVSFARAGCFPWKLTWPVAIASIPAAWVGGRLETSLQIYDVLLACVLGMAAWRLWIACPTVLEPVAAPPSLAILIPTGAGIGILSGIVGIGGGIFLSPLLILKRWTTPKRAAATSAFFIVANSAAGLLGRISKGTFVAGPLGWFLLAAALGGTIGSMWGADYLSGSVLKRLLAVVLVVAAIKAIIR
jgi:uncharacterized membrane protein YfcA